MGQIDLVEWLGYLASILVLISLLMSSIVKLRWINLVGSTIFSIYGFAIGAIPVGVVNFFIALINIYYLVKIYSAKTSKEFFKLLEVNHRDKYVTYFLEFYSSEIKKYFPNFAPRVEENTVSFFILRNMVPAGIFLGKKLEDNTLLVELDFVIPEYRDFKIGSYIYQEQSKYFTKNGYTTLVTYPHSEKHENYLKKMGFQPSSKDGKSLYIKKL